MCSFFHAYMLRCFVGYVIAPVEFGIQNAGIWTGRDQRRLQKMNVEFVEISQWTIRYYVLRTEEVADLIRVMLLICVANNTR
jgi:hypothetical protein